MTRTRRRAGSSTALAAGALLGAALIAGVAALGRRAPREATPATATTATTAPSRATPPDPAALRALFSRHLADYVVALDAARRGGDAAAAALARRRAAIEALDLGALAAPVAALLAVLAAPDRAPDAPAAAVARLDAALDAAALPYYVTFERLGEGIDLVFAFAIERATRFEADGRVVRALRLARLDDLAFAYDAYGFASPEVADALVMMRPIDDQLAELPALLAAEPDLAGDLGPDPAARREQLARAVELHEVQHRVDLARWPPAMPAPLAALVGAPAMTGRFDGIAELALAELSAYLAELARAPTDARLRLALLVRAALAPDHAGDPTSYAAVVLLDALARELGVGSREALIVARELEPRIALDRQRAILARPSAEIAAAASALWQRWFGRPLPALVQVGPQAAP